MAFKRALVVDDSKLARVALKKMLEEHELAVEFFERSLEMADAVEARHDPDRPQAQPVPLSEALRDSLSFLGVMIVANLLALVLYLLFAPFAPLIFWGLNGYLLGREYFMMVAIRRLGRAEAGRMRARHWLTLWIAGFLMVWPLSIPVVNLLIPVLGAATFTHIYHALQERS